MTRRTLLAMAASSGAPFLSAAAPRKVMLDTDCAYFSDDGAALCMLLRSPEKVSLLGITVVAGNLWPMQGAEYMLHVLRLMDKPDVPLYIGAQAPLLMTRERAEDMKRFGPVKWTGAFGQPVPHSMRDLKPPHGGKFSGLKPRPGNGVDFLIDTIDRNPGEVTILAIGPLTNLAIAIRLRPDIETKIGSLVLMGGSAKAPGNITPYAEFNWWFDPEAAAIVMRSAIPNKVMFGLDICERYPLNREHMQRIFAKKTPITELYKADRGNSASSFIWDCLPAGWLIDDSWVTKSEVMNIDCETAFGPRYGATVIGGSKPARVMLDLDFEKFFALYEQLLSS